MSIKLDEWYYDNNKEDFLNTIKRFPYVPFFVECSCFFGEKLTMRWNKNNQTIEKENENNEWETIYVDEVFDGNILVDYIVFKSKCDPKTVIDDIPIYLGW
jgi:hypothetical protein